MFEKWRIKEHMEVADSSGRHIGTVDAVEDDRIRLTRTDSPDGSHHYVDIDMVEKIDDNRVYLKAGEMQSSAGGSEPVYAGSHGTGQPEPQEEEALFGTSGHGTGMGGSGTM